MAVDNDEIQPIYANSWYAQDSPSVQELRQELQNLYEQLRRLNDKIDELHP